MACAWLIVGYGFSTEDAVDNILWERRGAWPWRRREYVLWAFKILEDARHEIVRYFERNLLVTQNAFLMARYGAADAAVSGCCCAISCCGRCCVRMLLRNTLLRTLLCEDVAVSEDGVADASV